MGGWEEEESLTGPNREINPKYYTKSTLLEINDCNRFRKTFAETVAKSWFAQKHHSTFYYKLFYIFNFYYFFDHLTV